MADEDFIIQFQTVGIQAAIEAMNALMQAANLASAAVATAQAQAGSAGIAAGASAASQGFTKLGVDIDLVRQKLSNAGRDQAFADQFIKNVEAADSAFTRFRVNQSSGFGTLASDQLKVNLGYEGMINLLGRSSAAAQPFIAALREINALQPTAIISSLFGNGAAGAGISGSLNRQLQAGLPLNQSNLAVLSAGQANLQRASVGRPESDPIVQAAIQARAELEKLQAVAAAPPNARSFAPVLTGQLEGLIAPTQQIGETIQSVNAQLATGNTTKATSGLQSLREQYTIAAKNGLEFGNSLTLVEQKLTELQVRAEAAKVVGNIFGPQGQTGVASKIQASLTQGNAPSPVAINTVALGSEQIQGLIAQARAAGLDNTVINELTASLERVQAAEREFGAAIGATAGPLAREVARLQGAAAEFEHFAAVQASSGRSLNTRQLDTAITTYGQLGNAAKAATVENAAFGTVATAAAARQGQLQSQLDQSRASLDKWNQGFTSHTFRIAQGLIVYQAFGQVLFGVTNSIRLLANTSLELQRFELVAGFLPTDQLKAFSSALGQVAIETNTNFSEIVASSDQVTAALIGQGKTAKEVADQAVQFQRISGEFQNVLGPTANFGQVTTDLIAIFKTLGGGSVQDFQRLSDTIVVAGGHSSQRIQQIIDGLARIGPAAKDSGADAKLLANIIGDTVRDTGRTGEEVANVLAGALEKLGRAATVKKAFADIKEGIVQITDAAGHLLPATQILQNLFDAFQKGTVNAGQVKTVLNSLIGINPANSAIVKAIFDDLGNAAIEAGRKADGALKTTSDALVDTLSGKFGQLGVALNVALVTGLGDPLVTITKSVLTGLKSITDLLNEKSPFGAMLRGTLQVGTGILVLLGTVKLLEFAFGRIDLLWKSFGARVTAIGNGLVVAARSGAAAAVATTPVSGAGLAPLVAGEAVTTSAATARLDALAKTQARVAAGNLAIGASSGAAVAGEEAVGVGASGAARSLGFATIAANLFRASLRFLVPFAVFEALSLLVSAVGNATDKLSSLDKLAGDTGVEALNKANNITATFTNPAGQTFSLGQAEKFAAGGSLSPDAINGTSAQKAQVDNINLLVEKTKELNDAGQLTDERQVALTRTILDSNGALKGTRVTVDDFDKALTDLSASTDGASGAGQNWKQILLDLQGPLADVTTATIEQTNATKRANNALVESFQIDSLAAAQIRKLNDEFASGKIKKDDYTKGLSDVSTAQDNAAKFAGALGKELLKIPAIQADVAKTGDTIAQATFKWLFASKDAMPAIIAELDQLLARQTAVDKLADLNAAKAKDTATSAAASAAAAAKTTAPVKVPLVFDTEALQTGFDAFKNQKFDFGAINVALGKALVLPNFDNLRNQITTNVQKLVDDEKAAQAEINAHPLNPKIDLDSLKRDQTGARSSIQNLIANVESAQEALKVLPLTPQIQTQLNQLASLRSFLVNILNLVSNTNVTVTRNPVTPRVNNVPFFQGIGVSNKGLQALAHDVGATNTFLAQNPITPMMNIQPLIQEILGVAPILRGFFSFLGLVAPAATAATSAIGGLDLSKLEAIAKLGQAGATGTKGFGASATDTTTKQTSIVDIGDLSPNKISQIIALALSAQKAVVAAGGTVDTKEITALFKGTQFEQLVKGIDQRFLQKAIEQLTAVEKKRLELEQQRLQDVTRNLLVRVGPVQSLVSQPVLSAGGGSLSGQGLNADPRLGNFTINVPINWSGMSLAQLQAFIIKVIGQAWIQAGRGA